MKAIFKSHFKPIRRALRSKNIYYLALLLLGSVTNALAANDGFSISEVQPTRIFQKEVGDQTRISFSAYGQTFNLLLEENKPLMKKNVSRLLDLELYAGTVEGMDNSWARISVVNGEYSGAVYDGDELYMLDTGKMLAESVDTNLKQTMLETSNVVYRASDLTSTLSCGLHEKHDEAQQFSYDGLVSELRNAQQSALAESTDSDSITAQATATQQVNLSIVTDTQYAATSPDGVEAQVLSQMNIVDGIFSEQVGVQFGIEEIRVLTNNGPLTSSSASTLLNQFRSFIGNDNPGLSHLFTGKNLDGNTIGIAFVSAICTANGVGVTQAGGRGTTGALTAAHEFGHNFGAPHDNQAGSACATTPGDFLMNPSINGSDQFSQCSLQQIENVLDVRSCLVDVEEPEPEPEPEPTPSAGFSVSATTAVEGEDDNVLFTITLDEPQDVAVGYDFATQAGTAIDGEDYVGRTGRVIFPAGVTVRERRVSILNDGVLGESDETFSLKVTDINNPAVNTVTEATIRETNALPVLTITDVQVDEGLGQAVVEFTLSAASANEVSVRFETISPQGANNPATDGDDYVGRTGRVVFQAGQTFKTRTVTIVDDNVAEADELFRIDLSDVVNVTLAPNNEQARIRILNDD